MRVHHRNACLWERDARLIGFDKAPLPPGVGGPLTVQGVRRLIKFEWQDVYTTRVSINYRAHRRARPYYILIMHDP